MALEKAKWEKRADKGKIGAMTADRSTVKRLSHDTL